MFNDSNAHLYVGGFTLGCIGLIGYLLRDLLASLRKDHADNAEEITRQGETLTDHERRLGYCEGRISRMD